MQRIVFLICLTACAAGLPAPKISVENTKQLQSTVSVDRDTYFPGEAAMFTVTVRNPGGAALEIPSTNGCFALRKVLEGGVSLPLSAQPICPSRVVENGPTTTSLGGGEQRQSMLSSDTLVSAMEERSAVLNRPGYYQLEYQYHYLHPSAVFHVVTPRLDAATVVKLQDVTYNDPNTGREVRIPAYAHVFALRWMNQSYICVSQSPDSSGRAVTADSKGDFEGADFPYVRIGTSAEAVKSIALSVDAHDRVTAMWVDAAGHWQGKSVNATAPDAEPRDVQIGLDSTLERVAPADTRQFTATVIGAAVTGVKWSVAVAQGAPAGAAAGTVSGAGRYAAPVNVARPYQVIVRARVAGGSAIAVVNLGAGRGAQKGAGIRGLGSPKREGTAETVASVSAPSLD